MAHPRCNRLCCNILRRGEEWRKLSQEKQIQMSDRQGRKRTRQVQGEYLVSCKPKIRT